MVMTRISRIAGLAVMSMVLSSAAVVAADPSPTPTGPMALMDITGLDQGLGVGNGPVTLRIGDACVTLHGTRGPVTTAAWPAGQTSWDASARAITFTEPGHDPVTLTDGQRLTLGGVRFEGPTAPADLGVSWTEPPAPACTGPSFIVLEVTRAGSVTIPTTPVRMTSRACIRDAYRASGDSLRSDIAATAEASRWTVHQAETRYCSTQALGRVLKAVPPDILTGGIVSDDPMGAPRLYLKGVAPDSVRALIDTAAIPIEVRSV